MSTTRKKRKLSQPTKCLSRRAGRSLQYQLLSISAADLMKDHVSLSSDGFDAKITLTDVLNDDFKILLTKTTNEQSTSTQGIHGGGSCELDEKKLQFVTTVSDRARELVTEKDSLRFRAWKLLALCHVAIALWDRTLDTLEIFDSLGSNNEGVREFQLIMIRAIFNGSQLPKNIHFVNGMCLQQKDDRFCQSYIFFYVYKRAISRQSIKSVLKILQKKTPYERFCLMHQFWNFLIYS